MNPDVVLTPEQNRLALLILLGATVLTQLYHLLIVRLSRRLDRPMPLMGLRELRWLLALLSILLAVIGAVGASLNAVSDRAPELLALVPLFLTMLVPWGVLRRVLAPLGQVRASHLLAELSTVGFGSDPRGGAAMAAALALLHKTNASDDDVAWVEEQLKLARPLHAGGLAAAAVMRLRGRDPEGARQLFQSVELLTSATSPLLPRRVAGEWLAADAASRGDWERVVALTASPGVLHTSRATWLLGAVARRLLRREDAPSDERLWALWLLAPARSHTRPLLHRALATPRGAEAPASREAPYTAEPADPLLRALTLQARLWGRGSLSLDELARLGEAWDDALRDSALERRLLIRSAELGTHEGSRVRAQLGDMAAQQLANHARERGLPLGSLEAPGPTIERATRLLRDVMLTELESVCDSVRRRAIDQRELPPVDEWREWLAIRRRYERLGSIAGPVGRRLAWPKVRDDICKLAVWLWNVRNEKIIAHAMFRWLLDEATALDDHEAIALQKKNVDCGTA